MTVASRRRTAAVFIVMCACIVFTACATAPSAEAESSRVRTLRERLCLLDGYLEHYANAHYSFYPIVSKVRRGGIPAPIWPRNPWTGNRMRPGHGVGDFTYTPTKRRLAYTLTGYYPSGSITLKGRVPQSRKMQNDHRTLEGAQLVHRFIEQWAASHGGVPPAASQVDADAAVGKQPGIYWWPHDPWTHHTIRIGTGWSEFSYSVDPKTDRYTMTMHFSRGFNKTYRGPQAWSAASVPFLSLIPVCDDATDAQLGI